MIVCFTVVLAACQSSDPARPTVSLLPDTTAHGGSWDWSAECPSGPSAAGGCQKAGPDLGHLQLDGDEWNLGKEPTGVGSVRMSMGSGGALTVTGNLVSAPPCTAAACLAPDADTWVRGYPNVLYGTSPCQAATAPPTSASLPLPMRVSTIPSDLIGTTSYSSETSRVTYDIAYDMWLNPSSTRSPCRTDGTVELMVWTDYDHRALLPDSLKVGTATIPFAVNGSGDPGTNDWSIYASDIGRAGQTVPWGGTLWLVLDKTDVVSEGIVSVDLSGALSAAGALLQDNYGWQDFAGNYWLDSVPFGMEFGPSAGTTTDSGPTRFSLNLWSYCLDVKAEPSEAAC